MIARALCRLLTHKGFRRVFPDSELSPLVCTRCECVWPCRR